MFTITLVIARQAIISWVTLSLVPVEIMFDAIELELDRRGIRS
jgi:hypothetical protein